MPIALTSRTRYKKFSFKAPVIVHRGNLQQSAQQVDVDGVDEDAQPALGVDLSEVTEHHLQAALSSTQLAVEGDKSIAAKPAYHIPTPEAKRVLAAKQYADLYPSGAYQDPVTYVRSSDTVEDRIRGASYNLDEDDVEWLEQRNAKAKEAAKAALEEMKPAAIAKLGIAINGSLKGKEKEQSKDRLIVALGQEKVEFREITEDELEMVITVFEQACSEKVPFAHLDLSKLPSSETLLAAFDEDSPYVQQAYPELPEMSWQAEASASSKPVPTWSTSNPWRNLVALKPIAALIYPWWRQRREDNGGKGIVPQLNFDESNDSDPYVCFRRREVKLTRKTRKTDVMQLEKLIKLSREMEVAVSLLEKLAQREKTKRASLAKDLTCWQSIKELQEVKRLWGIVGPNEGREDEEIISGERRDEAGYGVNSAPKKKRKTEEAIAAAAAANAGGSAVAAAAGKVVSKKTRPSDEPSTAAAATAAGPAAGAQSLGQAIMERANAVQAYIERECLRKAETDLGWEEGSDAAYQPIPAPAHIRSFRPIQSDGIDPPPFASSPTVRAGRPPSFRRRIGRGGRVFLDRRLLEPSPVPAKLAQWPDHRSGSDTLKDDEAAQNPTWAPESDALAPHPASYYTNPGRQEEQKREVFTGPFAFSSNLTPSLLASSGRGRDTGPSRSFVPAAPVHSSISDSESTSSEASDHSKASSASATSAVSTNATEVEETEPAGSSGQGSKRQKELASSDAESDSDSDSDSDSESDVEELAERLRAQAERWRYDDESGTWAGLGLCGLGGMEDDEEAVLDDFDQRFVKYRISLLEEEDLHKLSTDWTNVMQAQMALDLPTPPTQVSVIGPRISASQSAAQRSSYDATAATRSSSPIAAANGANPPSPRTAAKMQAQAQAQMQQLRQQQAAALAAATATGNSSLTAAVGMSMPPNVPIPMTGLPATTPTALAARAAQTNVGGPLPALQQQQLQQAQLQLAMQQRQQQQQQLQQQQRAAAQATAGTPAVNNQGRSSPNLTQQQQQQLQQQQRARLLSASNGSQPHPLSQSSNGLANGMGMSSSGSPQLQQQLAQAGSSTGIPLSARSSQQGQQYRLNFNNMNGVNGANNIVSSPQLQAALAASQQRPSSSPVPSAVPNSSPLMQHQQGAYQSQQTSRSPSMTGMSPPQQHALAMPLQGQQQQRLPSGSFTQQQQQQLQQLQMQFNNGVNATGGSNIAAQHANSLAQLQQQLALMQAQHAKQQQQQGMNGSNTASSNGNGMPSGTPNAAQLMAMKVALAQSMNNGNFQLKMPMNRGMQQQQGLVGNNGNGATIGSSSGNTNGNQGS